MPTTVANIRHMPFDVLIDRGTMWGNPFKLGKDGSRDEVIYKHRKWLRENTKLMANLHLLRGKRLGCHCAPLPCHGDNYVIACDTPELL